MNAVVVKAGEGHALRLGDVQMVVKEDGTHTRGALGLAEFEVPPQGHDVPPAHIHHAHEEGFYIPRPANWSLWSERKLCGSARDHS